MISIIIIIVGTTMCTSIVITCSIICIPIGIAVFVIISIMGIIIHEWAQ